jgi:AhpD family alkylhydroperoxidase
VTSPRIPPILVKEWPEGMRDAMRALRVENPRHPYPKIDPGRPKALNPLGVLAHHPTLTTAYHRFNGRVQFGTTLTPRQRELLVLRVAHARGCEYEWLQHSVLAGDAGMSDDEVARVAESTEDPAWSPLEAALLRAAYELVADACISDETWAALTAELDAQQMMDAVFTGGTYEVLAMAFNSFGIQIGGDLRAVRKRAFQ